MGFLKKLGKVIKKADPIGSKILGSKAGKVLDPIGHKMVAGSKKKPASNGMAKPSLGTSKSAVVAPSSPARRLASAANPTKGMRFNKR